MRGIVLISMLAELLILLANSPKRSSQSCLGIANRRQCTAVGRRGDHRRRTYARRVQPCGSASVRPSRRWPGCSPAQRPARRGATCSSSCRMPIHENQEDPQCRSVRGSHVGPLRTVSPEQTDSPRWEGVARKGGACSRSGCYRAVAMFRPTLAVDAVP